MAPLKIALVSVFFTFFMAFMLLPSQKAHAVVCFKTGEQISGMNKICFYDCLGSTAAITISSVSLCPLTITR